MLATILSGGLATSVVKSCASVYGVSQVFMAIDIKNLINFPSIAGSLQHIIDDLKKSQPENETTKIRYPGENVVHIRNSNLKEGIPVNKGVWDKILSL